MDREYVNSSMITGIGYDASTSILEVEFKDGAVWDYADVPEYLWHEFREAESKGKFFLQNIREQYTPNGYRVQ